MTMYGLSATAHFSQEGLFVSDKPIYRNNEHLPFGKATKAAYKSMHISYPKFYKMDGISKIGFLTAESLMNETNLLLRYSSNRIGIVVTTRSGCTETDKAFEQTIENKEEWYPSPALFVYTLPNIVIGEITIRHKITGESCCFVEENITPNTVAWYAKHLLDTAKIDAAIVGFLEYREDCFAAVLHTVERKQNGRKVDFTEELLQKQWSTLLEVLPCGN